MTDDNKISLFILEFIKKTKKKSIEWSESKYSPTLPDGNERLVDLSYSSVINEKVFRLYKYNIKTYRDEFDWDWSERIRLELTDGYGNTTFEFPYEYSLHDLYNSVRENNSGINDFINDFLCNDCFIVLYA